MANNPDDDDLPFGGLTLMQRLKAALNQTTAAVKALVPFLVTLQPGRAPDPRLQREAVKHGLEVLRDLSGTLLLPDLLPAGILHMLGPAPPVDASEDAHNLRVIEEVHFVLDWLAEIVPLDSINAVRADLKRLEQRHAPLTLRRDYYADPRTRDPTELADREFAVLLTHFVAAAQKISIPALLERLGVGLTYDAFRKWAAEVDREQRDLMDEAGKLAITGGGLALAQAARLSERSQDVLLRDDPDRFPDLAGLSDEDKLRTLFARATRSGGFARS